MISVADPALIATTLPRSATRTGQGTSGIGAADEVLTLTTGSDRQRRSSSICRIAHCTARRTAGDRSSLTASSAGRADLLSI
jgi:hypothetical protein